jgi:hypothetical protein
MTRARLNSEELDLIEEAMIQLGVVLNQDKPTKFESEVVKVTTTLQKINLIRKCSREDGIDISPAHGG